MSVLCRLGFHSWPRVHGSWREPVIEPAEATCRRCEKLIRGIWQTVYPQDGSRCGPGSCAIHGNAKAGGRHRRVESQLGNLSERDQLAGSLPFDAPNRLAP